MIEYLKSEAAKVEGLESALEKIEKLAPGIVNDVEGIWGEDGKKGADHLLGVLKAVLASDLDHAKYCGKDLEWNKKFKPIDPKGSPKKVEYLKKD